MSDTSNFIGWVTRMPTIKRWSLMHSYKDENIAEHSQQVAIISHLLAVIKNELFGGNLIPERAATIAIYHEMSEIFSGDLATPIKYFSPEITKAYKQIEAFSEKRCVESLPSCLQSAFSSFIIQNEVEPEYKNLVKAADTIAAYIKAKDEVHHGNPEFYHVVDNIEAVIDKIKNESPEVAYFIDTFLPSCVVTLDELSSSEK